MLKLGIVGRGISYSLSPLIHKEAMRILGIKGDYDIFDRDEAELEHFIQQCSETGIRGLNVTTPYKEIIVKYCAEISDSANHVGAVNTLTFGNGTIRGDNTDHIGFEKALLELIGKQPLPCVIVLGNGGAARAVLSVLLSKPSVREIHIIARRYGSANQQLTDLIKGQNITVHSFADPRLATTVGRASLIVNCTTVGSATNPGQSLPWCDHLSSSTAVMDLVYSPAKTELLTTAQQAGCLWQNGFEMLLHQAAVSFKIWTGKTFPLREVRTTLQKEVADE